MNNSCCAPNVKNETQVVETSGRFVTPRIDMLKRQDGLLLLVDLPGTDEKGLDLNIEKNVLTITGQPQAEPHDGFEPVYREYQAFPYKRAFTLSEEVDTAKIDASMKDGVLRLFFPYSETTKPRKIAVRQG